MVVKILCLFLSIVSFSPVLGRNSQEDFLEWSPYDPLDIPTGAITLNRTLDMIYIYTGRAYVTDGDKEGYIPVDIIEGNPCAYGLLDLDVIQVCDNITILSGKNDFLNNLLWYQLRAPYFLDLLDNDEYHPVRIGWEVGADNNVPFNTTLYYARSYYSGRFWGTKIATSRPNQDMDNIGYIAYENFYNGNTSTYFSVNYDVLVFRY